MLPPVLSTKTCFTPNIILAHPEQLDKHPRKDLIMSSHFGYDKECHPIYWEKTGSISSNFRELATVFSTEELVFFHIQSNEAFELRLKHASRKYNQEVTKYVVVFDLLNLSHSLDLGSIKYIKSILAIDQVTTLTTLTTSTLPALPINSSLVICESVFVCV